MSKLYSGKCPLCGYHVNLTPYLLYEMPVHTGCLEVYNAMQPYEKELLHHIKGFPPFKKEVKENFYQNDIKAEWVIEECIFIYPDNDREIYDLMDSMLDHRAFFAIWFTYHNLESYLPAYSTQGAITHMKQSHIWN
jgi:hypothetical protein